MGTARVGPPLQGGAPRDPTLIRPRLVIVRGVPVPRWCKALLEKAKAWEFETDAVMEWRCKSVRYPTEFDVIRRRATKGQPTPACCSCLTSKVPRQQPILYSARHITGDSQWVGRTSGVPGPSIRPS